MKITAYEPPIIPHETMILDLVVFKKETTIHARERGTPNKNNPA